MTIKIGIAAHSEVKERRHAESAAKFIHELKGCALKHGFLEQTYILLGGYWGLMKVIAEEALNANFKVIFFPPQERDDESEYPSNSIVIRTGLSSRGRSIALVRSSHYLVVLGGQAGTILEALAAYTENVPVFVLVDLGLPSDKLMYFSPYVDERLNAPVYIYDNVTELVEGLCDVIVEEKLEGG